MNQKTGNRTLLWSVIMSSPGPLVVGLGLFAGQSATQVADFVRRSAELFGIIMAFAVYRMTARNGECDTARKEKLEKFSNIFVGAMMCIGGSIMLALSFLSENTDKGNVIFGLIIALLGVAANAIFWRKYTRLNKAEPNAILAVQARLYRAKSLVDLCVTTALLSVALFPKAEFSYMLDKIGSAVVAVYLVWCGAKTIYERLQKSTASVKKKR